MSTIRECLPIDNFEDLVVWRPEDCAVDRSLINGLTTHRSFAGPKVIVCHDMKGGYLEDRFIDGDDNYQAFRFFHWSLIDSFIYFSHNFITIPPLTWTNAAHVNGVSVLGTFITEGKIGAEICSSFLESGETIELICHKLVDIALYFKFEGWFINIENSITKAHVPKLLQFIETLRNLVKKSIPKGQVLWYDSVTINGSLDWQNCLNHENVAFFQCCDGIFLNYTWNDHNLRDTSGFAASMGRLNDVFVGVDVFGRGMVGGGGFATHIAVEKIRTNLLPLAIFAPGWVWEILGPENFTENNLKFWDRLTLKVRHLPEETPFRTNFCQGFGLSRFENGLKMSDKPWFNLSRVQPTTRNYVDGEIFLGDSYEGGHSIRIINWAEPILECHFSLSIGLTVQLIFKIIDSDTELPSLKVKMRYQKPGLDDILLLNEENCSQKVLNSGEEPRILNESGWASARFNLDPVDDAVLRSITIERMDSWCESKFLVGVVEVDVPFVIRTG